MKPSLQKITQERKPMRQVAVPAPPRRVPQPLLRLSCVAAGLLGALLLAELVTRMTWDKAQGVPGLLLGHPRRIEVFAPNYTGYYLGQPLRINRLGFRDNREYVLAKDPSVFRIVVLGDSVTFGYRVPFEETWPFLLEQRLKRWSPAVQWQVWNLGVPGYDAIREAYTLEELAPHYRPDLVIVGVYENDLISCTWDLSPPPDWVYQVRGWLKRHLYLYHPVRTACHRLRHSYTIDGLNPAQSEQRRLSKPAQPPLRYDLVSFETKLKHRDPAAAHPPPPRETYQPDSEGLRYWRSGIDRLKRYHEAGSSPVVFFVNIAPDVNEHATAFIDGMHNGMNTFFVNELSQPTPVVSSFDAFWSYAPADVPGAGDHSLGPANLVKADVLFDFIVTRLETVRRAGPHSP